MCLLAKPIKDIIGKVTLMIHWYCKATYNLGQFFSSKRHTIWDEGNMS